MTMAVNKGGDIKIRILTLDSKTYTTRVEKSVSVPTLKQEIARLTGVIPDHQRLLCHGKLVKDDQILSDYHVEDGHTLHLVVNQPSEPSESTEQAEDLRTLINRDRILAGDEIVYRVLTNQISAGESLLEIDVDEDEDHREGEGEGEGEYEYEDGDEDVRIFTESIYPSINEAQTWNLVALAFTNNDALLNMFAGDRDNASFSALLRVLQGIRQVLVQYLLNSINDLGEFAGFIHRLTGSVSARADIIERAHAIMRMPATEIGQPPADGSRYFLSNVIRHITTSRSENNNTSGRVEQELPSRRRTREDDDPSGQQAAGAKRTRRYSL